MQFLGWFRRSSSIADRSALAQFIDGNAAFLVQKGIYEYSRARAGHYAKVMFGEQMFIDAFDRARWQAYPLGLAMVAKWSRACCVAAAAPTHGSLAWVSALVLSVFDSHPVPPWWVRRPGAKRAQKLALRLQHIGLHPPSARWTFRKRWRKPISS